jgi:hypothetical protein
LCGRCSFIRKIFVSNTVSALNHTRRNDHPGVGLLFCSADDDTGLCNGDAGYEELDAEVALNRGGTSDMCAGGSPGAQRRKRLCKLRDSLKCRDMVDNDRSTPDGDNIYSDNLPEVSVCVYKRDRLLLRNALRECVQSCARKNRDKRSVRAAYENILLLCVM